MDYSHRKQRQEQLFKFSVKKKKKTYHYKITKSLFWNVL